MFPITNLSLHSFEFITVPSTRDFHSIWRHLPGDCIISNSCSVNSGSTHDRSFPGF